jgi:assimilatory nitrate reductase electron transfer subunit
MIRALAGGGVGAATRDPQDLADADHVCNCNTVTAGQVRHAIGDGCDSVGAIAKATRATTGCGDCTSLVEGLLACHPSTNQPAAAIKGA